MDLNKEEAETVSSSNGNLLILNQKGLYPKNISYKYFRQPPMPLNSYVSEGILGTRSPPFRIGWSGAMGGPGQIRERPWSVDHPVQNGRSRLDCRWIQAGVITRRQMLYLLGK